MVLVDAVTKALTDKHDTDVKALTDKHDTDVKALTYRHNTDLMTIYGKLGIESKLFNLYSVIY